MSSGLEGDGTAGKTGAGAENSVCTEILLESKVAFEAVVMTRLVEDQETSSNRDLGRSTLVSLQVIRGVRYHWLGLFVATCHAPSPHPIFVRGTS